MIEIEADNELQKLTVTISPAGRSSEKNTVRLSYCWLEDFLCLPFTMEASERLKMAIEQLYYWQYSNGDNFTSKLYALIAKADSENRAKLRLAFPTESAAFTLWQSSQNPIEFFYHYLSLPSEYFRKTKLKEEGAVKK